MFDQTITRLRAGVRANRAGDAVPDWDQAARVLVGRVNVQPLSSAERVAVGGDMSVAMARVITGRGVDADVLATDRIEHNGDTYEVVGPAARWPDPSRSGRVHHCEFVIKLWGTT